MLYKINKQFLLSYAFLSILAFSLPAQVKAGSVQLISDNWDYICKVQIVHGMNAPGAGGRSTYRDVNRGWSVTRQDRLCYRRSANPGDCGSGYNSWDCASQLTSGTYKFSLR